MDRIDQLMELEMQKRQPTKDANMPKIGNEPTEYQDTNIYMNDDLYRTAKYGNRNDFSSILDEVTVNHVSVSDVLWRISPGGNTLLHVAAKHGNVDIVTYIAEKDSSLITKRNLNGDTALHLAAKFGDFATIEALVLCQIRLKDNRKLLRANMRGNTVLHEVIHNCRGESIAEYLMRQDPELLYFPNYQGEYVLYLAAKGNCVRCVASILKLSTDKERLMNQFKKKSPIKAAIANNNKEILSTILNWQPSFIGIRDDRGRTPLHYAAELGDVDVFRYLMKLHSPHALKQDNSGLFPIHLAIIRGHIDIINRFLESCPDPEELLDWEDRNVLHFAAENGRYKVVKYILNNPKLEQLINMKDKYGNVPLHLATINWHPTIVSLLTWDKRVDVTLVNDKGLTALDAAEDQFDYNPTFRQRLTWSALKSGRTPRSPFRKTSVKSSSKSTSNGENYKERVNTLLLVSTLVATITFAAGFTLPGGYNNSDKDLGMAAMLRSTGFHIFVFCDTIAVYTSVVVAVTLVWAQFGGLNLVLTALNLAMPLLGISLSMMSIAFTAGIYLVVSRLRWLGTTVLVLGFSFLAILLAFLVPLCMPLTSTNLIIRHIGYYPFRLLVIVTRSHSRDKVDERKSL